MTNELQDLLVATLKDTKQSAGEAVGWVLKQAPDVCEQYLRYELFRASFIAFGFLLGAIGCVWIAHALWKTYSGSADKYWAWVPCVFAVFFVCAGVFPNVLGAAKVYLAPKVVLIELAKSFLR